MGGTTPVFGIRFPFQHEVEDAAHFQQFADDVDAALDLLTTTGDSARNRARVTLRKPSTGGGTTASGATTDIPWTQVNGEDPSTMWTSGATVTLPVKGLYMVKVEVGQASPVTTVIAQRLQVSVGGQQQLANRMYRDGRSITDPMGVSGFVYASAASAALVAAYRWDGTGGPADLPTATMTIALWAQVP